MAGTVATKKNAAMNARQVGLMVSRRKSEQMHDCIPPANNWKERDGRNWPAAEMPAADRHGRLLGYCGRHRASTGMVDTARRTGRALDGRPKRLARVAAAGETPRRYR